MLASWSDMLVGEEVPERDCVPTLQCLGLGPDIILGPEEEEEEQTDTGHCSSATGTAKASTPMGGRKDSKLPLLPIDVRRIPTPARAPPQEQLPAQQQPQAQQQWGA